MKAICQNCGHSFITAGIFPASDGFLCSVKCSTAYFGGREEIGVAYQIRSVPKAPEPDMFHQGHFQFPVGLAFRH